GVHGVHRGRRPQRPARGGGEPAAGRLHVERGARQLEHASRTEPQSIPRWPIRNWPPVPFSATLTKISTCDTHDPQMANRLHWPAVVGRWSGRRQQMLWAKPATLWHTKLLYISPIARRAL